METSDKSDETVRFDEARRVVKEAEDDGSVSVESTPGPVRYDGKDEVSDEYTKLALEAESVIADFAQSYGYVFTPESEASPQGLRHPKGYEGVLEDARERSKWSPALADAFEATLRMADWSVPERYDRVI